MQSKDKTVTIYINDVEVQAPEKKMTGAEIKALGNIPSAHKLYKEMPGPRPDKLIEDNEIVHLKEGDRFYDIPPGTKGEDLQGVLPLVRNQIERVRQDYPDLIVSSHPDGIELEIPCIYIPDGWTKQEVRVMILVPNGYPDNRPQGFFVDSDLKLASGQGAGGFGNQMIHNRNWGYFCWNAAAWDPRRDGLWKYVKIAISRFEDKS